MVAVEAKYCIKFDRRCFMYQKPTLSFIDLFSNLGNASPILVKFRVHIIICNRLYGVGFLMTIVGFLVTILDVNHDRPSSSSLSKLPSLSLVSFICSGVGGAVSPHLTYTQPCTPQKALTQTYQKKLNVDYSKVYQHLQLNTTSPNLTEGGISPLYKETTMTQLRGI